MGKARGRSTPRASAARKADFVRPRVMGWGIDGMADYTNRAERAPEPAPSLGASGELRKNSLYSRGWPAEFSHCVQEIGEGPHPLKQRPCTFIVTPWGKLLFSI
jgi:hypothetical protein